MARSRKRSQNEKWEEEDKDQEQEVEDKDQEQEVEDKDQEQVEQEDKDQEQVEQEDKDQEQVEQEDKDQEQEVEQYRVYNELALTMKRSASGGVSHTLIILYTDTRSLCYGSHCYIRLCYQAMPYTLK
nr:glutamic acid-rich protein-like [Procambarus clarkii]